MSNRISVIIPTKNRPLDLYKAVKSILSQSMRPDELIIIDQSESSHSLNLLECYFHEALYTNYKYILDPNINGLVSAKKKGVSNSSGDIILFLEDDIVLESSYIENIEKGFVSNSNMLGCSGIIINQPNKSKAYQIFFDIFHFGIFQDKRNKFFGKKYIESNLFIPSNTLSGGVSSWRKEVFVSVPFDDINGFHMLEDIDFSTRAACHFGNRFFINTMAHLSHFSSPINRSSSKLKHYRKVCEFILFYKKRRNLPFAFNSLIWLLIGLLLDAIFQALCNKSFEPLAGYINGVKDGFAKEINL